MFNISLRTEVFPGVQRKISYDLMFATLKEQEG